MGRNPSGRRCPSRQAKEPSQGTFTRDFRMGPSIAIAALGANDRGRPEAGSKNGSNRPASRRRPDLGFPAWAEGAGKPRLGVVSDRFAPIC